MLILGAWTVVGLLVDIALLLPRGMGGTQLVCCTALYWLSADNAWTQKSHNHTLVLPHSNGTGRIRLQQQVSGPLPGLSRKQLSNGKRVQVTKWNTSNHKVRLHDKVVHQRKAFFKMMSNMFRSNVKQRPSIHGVKSLRHELGVYLLAGIEPSYTCAVQERFGKMGDGGKVLCNPQAILSASDCLVYSFGSRLDCGFELDLKQQYPHCDVHVFDPAPSVVQQYNISHCAKNTTFHEFGLGGYEQSKRIENETVSLQPLSTTKQALGHGPRTLHILKADVEGSEYDAFQEMFDSNALNGVGVIMLEVHIRALIGRSRQEQTAEFLRLFTNLDDLGYVIYHKELNWVWGRSNAEFALVHRSLLPEFQVKSADVQQL